MLIRKPTMLDGSAIPSSEITPKAKAVNRRRFIQAAAAAGALAVASNRIAELVSPAQQVGASGRLNSRPGSLTTSGEPLNSLEDITSWNNFYEFGVDKREPAKNAVSLPTYPWTIQSSGLVKKPKAFDLDTLMKLHPLEDRVYRHRCVEGWSMVIPWVGYSLSELIKQCEPLSTAKYVQFVSYYNPAVEKWSGQTNIPWPYTEALRMDEAMNPLTLLTFGLYGNPLPMQNGAPVRVMIPWKYGFKSPKSVVALRFTNTMPQTIWTTVNNQIYGFYSNVYPDIVHPRWNQKMERRIGQPFWSQKRNTMVFNGYGDFVASMYHGMDLNKNY